MGCVLEEISQVHSKNANPYASTDISQIVQELVAREINQRVVTMRSLVIPTMTQYIPQIPEVKPFGGRGRTHARKFAAEVDIL